MRVGESFAPQHESSRPQELIELARPVSHWFIQPIDFHQISTNVISMICGILFGIRQWYGMASERVLDLNSWLMQRGAMHLNRAVDAVSTQPKIAPVVPTFPRSLPLFRLFAFPACILKPSIRPSWGCCKGCISMGSRRQSSDLRSHSLFPIAKGFYRSSGIPEWCNWCKLTRPPILWYCWLHQDPLLFQGQGAENHLLKLLHWFLVLAAR